MELMVYDEEAMVHCEPNPPPGSLAAVMAKPLNRRLRRVESVASLCADYNFTQQLAHDGLRDYFGTACEAVAAFPWVAKLHLCPAARLVNSSG